MVVRDAEREKNMNPLFNKRCVDISCHDCPLYSEKPVSLCEFQSYEKIKYLTFKEILNQAKREVERIEKITKETTEYHLMWFDKNAYHEKVFTDYDQALEEHRKCVKNKVEDKTVYIRLQMYKSTDKIHFYVSDIIYDWRLTDGSKDI